MKSRSIAGMKGSKLKVVLLAVISGALLGIPGWVSAEPLEVIIESDDRMNYDIDRFTVQPGQEVRLTLKHVGQIGVEAMGHNVVILKDTQANPIDFGMRVQQEGGNVGNHYLPESVRDDVIAFTELIGGGESSTVVFTAPEQPGEYPYLCSFPMHPELMTGVMVVEGDVEEPEPGAQADGVPGAEGLPDVGVMPDPEDLVFDPDALPELVEGFEAEIWVREPLLMHPSAMAFDGQGRLFVGGGPQYRDPAPDSPKDSVWVLIDETGDGAMDRMEVFATGLNSVQALAWRNGELWVANAPDVTVLRDTTGDLRADEFVRVYTNLGHLRHGLHGFNWAPDGRLYMNQGDSRVQDGAPQAFRDLHGVDSDEPDNQPLNEVYSPEEYEPDYIGSWPSASQGGWLRAGDRGQDLEIFSRGGRNPWDMTYTPSFDWLSSEQDPGDAGDQLLMPFQGAYFSTGHPRGGSWGGHDNPAVVPPSYHFTRYQKNSLVGMQYYLHEHFPEDYRDVIFINDWVNRNIYVFRPEWDGAFMIDGGDMEEFADGGQHGTAGELVFNPGEGDPLFRPTDLAIGPDGALYVAGWGTQYGSRWAPFIGGDADAGMHWGRVFRIRHSERELTPRDTWYAPKRDEPYENWSVGQLIEDLGAQLPVWRIDAQDELVRRGDDVRDELREAIRGGDLSQMAETYAVWALGRMGPDPSLFGQWARGEDGAELNRRLQAIRVIGDRGLESATGAVVNVLADGEPRIRFAAAQALMNLGADEHVEALLAVVEEENDPLCFYAQWLALKTLVDGGILAGIVADNDSINVQAAALLALGLNDEIVDCAEVAFSADGHALYDARLAVEQWIDRNCGNFDVTFQPSVSRFRDPFDLELVSESEDGHTMRYALGDAPLTADSPAYNEPIAVEGDTVVRAALFDGDRQVGPQRGISYDRISDEEWEARLFISDLHVSTNASYEVVEQGLTNGAMLYTDRDYVYSDVPGGLSEATYIRTANDDSIVTDEAHMRFRVNQPVTLYVAYDSRESGPPSWMPEAGFEDAGMSLQTTDVTFDLYRKEVEPGEIVLGGNGGADSMYQVLILHDR